MLELVQHNTGQSIWAAVTDMRPDPPPVPDGKMKHVANPATAVIHSLIHPVSGMDEVGEEIALMFFDAFQRLC
jgi:hypothetical protein